MTFPNLNPSLPVFCDIESEKLYVNCSMIQVRQNGIATIIEVTNDKEQAEAVEWLSQFHLVFYNGSYDVGTLNLVPRDIDDLFYATKIAYPQIQEYELDVVIRFLNFGHVYQGLPKSDMQKKGFVRGAYRSAVQIAYAKADVEALELLWADSRIQEVLQHNLAYRLGKYALLEAAAWQQNGLPIIKSRVDYYKKEAVEKVAQLKTTLPTTLNARSSPQVQALFGTQSADKPTLTRIAINGKLEAEKKSKSGRGISSTAKSFTPEEQKMAENILALRKSLNDLSKLEGYNKPKLYGRFNPMGATTSRWTCKGGDNPDYFNAQNYPRQFKSVFGVTPSSGQIIVAADYATLEIRIAAAIMDEPNMYQALMRGDDIHKATASLIYNKPIEEVHGRERSNAKVANFGLTYGMSLNTFIQYAFDMYGLKLTDEEARDIINRFFKAYPGLKAYHMKVGKAMKHGGYICQTALGYKMKPYNYTDAINGPTQGTGGECMRLALHNMFKKDKRAAQMIVNSIHDAIYLIVPEAEEAYWGEILRSSMQEAWYEIRKSPVFKYHDIPMPVDLMRGYNMGELEKDFAGGGQALSIEEMRASQERNKNAKS